MASVQKITETRVVTTGYNLSLSEQEASVLRSILHRVGGQPSGPRGVADSMIAALDRVGVTTVDVAANGSIILKDTFPESR